jgi:hypothetical protein
MQMPSKLNCTTFEGTEKRLIGATLATVAAMGTMKSLISAVGVDDVCQVECV